MGTQCQDPSQGTEDEDDGGDDDSKERTHSSGGVLQFDDGDAGVEDSVGVQAKFEAKQLG